jgi:hypothetical protein
MGRGSSRSGVRGRAAASSAQSAGKPEAAAPPMVPPKNVRRVILFMHTQSCVASINIISRPLPALKWMKSSGILALFSRAAQERNKFLDI